METLGIIFGLVAFVFAMDVKSKHKILEKRVAELESQVKS